MQIRTKILDKYFLDQIKKRGIKANEKEVTRFFEENGWRMYDFDSTWTSFNKWKKTK